MLLLILDRWRCQVSAFNRAQGRVVDISDGFTSQLSDEVVLIVEEVGLMVVVESLFKIKHQVVGESQRHQCLRAFGVDRETFFVGLNRVRPLLELAVAVS